MRIQLDSEVGRLRSVVVHTPGVEIEAVTPASAEELLYNDIIPLDDVRREHSRLLAVLEKVADVVQAETLLQKAVVDQEHRRQLALSLMRPDVRRRADPGRLAELAALPPAEFVQAMVTGIENRRTTFSDFLSPRRYDIPPLPNWYFMRDAAMAFGRELVIGSMAYAVRRNEAILARAMLEPFAPVLWDGTRVTEPGISLEGGDFLPVNPNLLVVGLSERTSAAGLDGLLDALRAQRSANGGEPCEIIAVQLPHARTCIHLDMAVTFVDRDCLLVYDPLILGRSRAPVLRCRIEPGKAPRIRPADSLPQALKEAGMPVATVSCADGRQVEGEREQWLAGTNVFAYAPGKVIAYDCNRVTLDAMNRAGFEIVAAADIISGRIDPLSPGRKVVTISGTEMARGGGGVRCMTLPLHRDPID
ncbi:MAG: arginine deiminase family protein [Spirochaeta sp.]